jgi:hypothetical protein
MADEVRYHAMDDYYSTLTGNPNQGASPRELVLEACRRNNTDLLQDVFDTFVKSHGEKKGTVEIAQLLNKSRDGIGNGVLHLAATNGHCTCPLPKLCKCARNH